MATRIRKVITTPSRRSYTTASRFSAAAQQRLARCLEGLRSTLDPIWVDRRNVVVLPELFDLEDQEPLTAYLRFCEPTRKNLHEDICELTRSRGVRFALPTMAANHYGWTNTLQWIAPNDGVFVRCDKVYPAAEELEAGDYDCSSTASGTPATGCCRRILTNLSQPIELLTAGGIAS